MSKTPKKLSPPYTLELSFDVDQITQALQYNLYRNYNESKPELCHMDQTGPLAGTYNFKQGDEIAVVVKATASSDSKTKPDLIINVTNCTIVCIQPPVDQALSLFDTHNACTPISEWSLPEEVPSSQKNQTCIKVTALNYLHVVADRGQWKMSGYLSVLFKIGKKSMSRLYYFDPETSSGSGIGLGGAGTGGTSSGPGGGS